MAKIENKPASAYDDPHGVGLKGAEGGVLKQTSGAKVIDELNVSIGKLSKNLGKGTKTDGIKIRGTGAATKGVMARGPMA